MKGLSATLFVHNEILACCAIQPYRPVINTFFVKQIAEEIALYASGGIQSS
jgi:hypothetical protein